MAGDSQRSPWIVAIIVALIGALGVVAAAVLPNLLGSGSTSGPAPSAADSSKVSPGPNPSEASTAPDIAGEYYFDQVGSSRIIIIRNVGGDTYDISEQEPAPWPFSGQVSWDGAAFTGRADFENSNDTMVVTLEPVGQGRLHALFEYTVPEGRVDDNTLYPVNG